jgi:hypothetical protein
MTIRENNYFNILNEGLKIIRTIHLEDKHKGIIIEIIESLLALECDQEGNIKGVTANKIKELILNHEICESLENFIEPAEIKKTICLNKLGFEANFIPSHISLASNTLFDNTIKRFMPSFNSSLFRITIRLDKYKVLEAFPDFDFKTSFIDLNVFWKNNSRCLQAYDIKIGKSVDRYKDTKEETVNEYRYEVKGNIYQSSICNTIFLAKWREMEAVFRLSDNKVDRRSEISGDLHKICRLDFSILEGLQILDIRSYGDTFKERLEDYNFNIKELKSKNALTKKNGKWEFHNQFQ